MTSKEAKNLRKEFPYLSVERIKLIAEHSQYNTMRGVKNELQRLNDKFAELDNVDSDHEVERVEIQLEWKDSRTWGWCPRATADIKYKNGKWRKEYAYASGCGYDKASTVVADILNKCARYKLWRKRNTRKELPYGINIGKGYLPYFDGGIGMDCYYSIAKFLGGKMTHVVNQPKYDYFTFDF